MLSSIIVIDVIITGCVLSNQNVFCLLQAMKVVGIKAHTENDKGQVLLDLYIRWSFIYELLELKTISVSLFLRMLYDSFFLFLQLCRQRGDRRWGEEILLQSRSQRNTGLLSWVWPSKKPPVSQHVFTNMLSSSVSPALWDDAGDSGTPDWRCANRRGSLHVFHQAACVSLSFHLCLSLHSHQYLRSQHSHLCLPCYWFLLHLDHFACLFLVSSQKLDINWTGLTNLLDIPGLKWVMLELSFLRPINRQNLRTVYNHFLLVSVSCLTAWLWMPLPPAWCCQIAWLSPWSRVCMWPSCAVLCPG